MEKVEIKLSNNKMIYFLICSIGFVILGALMVIDPESFISVIFHSPPIISIVGILGIIFFGISALFLLRKLFDINPGLIIDQYGITDNSNFISSGLIEWTDIIEYRIEKVKSTKFFIISILNPEKYIDEGKNDLVKKVRELNNKLYGSPISINSNALKCNFSELENLIKTSFKEYKTIDNTPKTKNHS